jgi:hypothetical protein
MTVTTQKSPPKNTGLKIIVGVLGAVLILGFFGLMGTIVYQAATLHKATPDQTKTAAAEGPPNFGNVTVPIRQGERIARVQPGGTRLFVEVATVEGNSRLLVIDPATGKLLGSIDFPQQP